jgi:hypothetical protein
MLNMILLSAGYIIYSVRVFMFGGRSITYLLKIKIPELTHGEC